ncbi:Epstein-Barr virus EBNA-1-like protein [Oryza sativa Japonica Group]|uniref:Epstein-Barr virus EBNA-1-like protein n=1 Tax=Oryza sativa subsp. japonica TaxID=39947 RepID=Q9ARU1_ORYSJ|nr:Epstein-Barr virus EBNA-1-like protein [Oryza sativa Japonica Group]
MGRPAREGGPRHAREGRRGGASGPGSPRVVPSGTRLSVARFTVRREHAARARIWGRDAVHARGSRGCGCGGPTRSLMAHGGPRARAGQRGAADRGRLDPVLAELAPTWRLRGCHTGRREVEDGAGQNGRRTAATNGGANHGDTGGSGHTGWLHETRGDDPTARIRRRELDGGGLRRRQPSAREGGNGDGATGGRFGRARASTRLRESVSSVRLDGDTTREAGDVWALPSTGGDGGEHTASGGNGRSKSKLALGGHGQNGDREDDAGGEKKEERKGERRLASCHFGKRRKEREGDEAVGGGALPPILGSMRGGRQALTAAATGRSATTARARAGSNGAGDSKLGGGARREERDGEGEQENEKEGELGSASAHAHARATHGRDEGEEG